ncbi:glycosyltransferase [Mucilaginibacter pallidiroseus]|uniref:Glycosyltransferase n=1 Tax=Mucilaginibacter pallidiroseus TaxID=2599295 RepID=A0A563U2F0_9SPHI|nr:glycosyltransferase [Mucilaginibacter pallidiroseus]TWR25199.1 glycosyltransferase [Mucilaginibacter pallidiroseus]
MELHQYAANTQGIFKIQDIKEGLKVLHVTAAYKPAVIYGGPTMSVSSLCEELVKSGQTIEVFTTTANGPTELDVKAGLRTSVDGVPVTYFKRLTKDHTHFSPALLKALWKRAAEFDAIHIHAWWNLVSVLSCLVAVIKKVPVIVSPRGMLSSYTFSNKNMGVKKLIHEIVGKKLLQKSHIHATSAYEAIAIAKLLTPLSITDIPNFVKLGSAIFKPKAHSQRTGVLKLLFFSRIEEKKGLDIFIDALPLINAPISLTIAGSGSIEYINQLKGKVSSLGLDDRINWVGFHDMDKFDVLAAHDLLVLPSYDENFGNVVVEALSVGTAVLISEHVGLAGYVAQNKLGWVCEQNTNDLANTINEIYINQGHQLARIRQEASDRVTADFSGAQLTQRYIDFYRQIISK